MTQGVQKLAHEDANSLGGVLAEWAERVFPRRSDEQRARIVAAAVAEVRESLARPGASGVALVRGEMVLGAALGAELALDSEHFGLGMGRIGPLWLGRSLAQSASRAEAAELVEGLLAELASHGVEHVTSRVEGADHAALHTLEEAGFRVVAGLVSLEVDLRKAGDLSMPARVRPFEERDLKRLKGIASVSFRGISRFHLDPRLEEERADAFHALWVENSVRGYADGTLVVEHQGEPAGFLTCHIQEDTLYGRLGRIGLIAVDGRAAGSGLGRDLIRGLMHWLAERGVRRLETGTEMHNHAALNFYHRVGFGVFASHYTLHWHGEARDARRKYSAV